MRWFQLSRVVLSDANTRIASCGSMRMPPRAVTAARLVALRDKLTGSSGSLVNSAMAPNVPRLQPVR